MNTIKERMLKSSGINISFSSLIYREKKGYSRKFNRCNEIRCYFLKKKKNMNKLIIEQIDYILSIEYVIIRYINVFDQTIFHLNRKSPNINYIRNEQWVFIIL